MNNEALVELLIARSFLDIRIAAHDKKHDVCFALSDLFHNVPYQMKKAREGEFDYSEIIKSLKSTAKQKNISKWLDNAINDITEP